MLDVENVLAVMSIADLEQAAPWYERLFGHPPDRWPGVQVAEWQLTGGGAVQLVQDADHAGTSLLTLEVADLDSALRDIAARGLADFADSRHESPDTRGRVARLQDPAGNTIVLVAQETTRPE